MPRLKTIVENLDDIPEALHDFYNETKLEDAEGKKHTKLVLQLDDDVRGHPTVSALQNAHERQKEENKELKAKYDDLVKVAEKMPEDFDPEDFERLKEVEHAFNKLKEEGEVDPEKRKAHEAELASFKKTFEQQQERLKKKAAEDIGERDKTIKSLTDRIHSMVIRDGLTRLLAENGVKKETLPFVQAKLERSAKVEENENGDPVMVFDTDMGPVPGSQYIPNWVQSDEAKPFIDQQMGGGAPGGSGRKGSLGDVNPWSAANWNMVRQGEILRKDPGRADSLAKKAGHVKGALGALRMDAK